MFPHAFVWAFYIHTGKILINHVLDMSSKDYDPIELKLVEEHRGG